MCNWGKLEIAQTNSRELAKKNWRILISWYTMKPFRIILQKHIDDMGNIGAIHIEKRL